MSVKTGNTLIIFSPVDLKNLFRTYLYGQFESFDNDVKIFYVNRPVHKESNLRKSFNKLHPYDKGNKCDLDYVHIEINQNVLRVRKIKIQGNCKDVNDYHIVWINYDFEIFSQCEVLPSENFNAYNSNSYFKYLKKKINEKVNHEEDNHNNKVVEVFIKLLTLTIIKLSNLSKKSLPFTKYLNIGLHLDSYLNSLVWVVESAKVKKKIDTKVKNFLISMFLDMLLGVLFLNWLNTKVSLDSFPTLFLITAETIVNSIKELINWLRGDPAGLKLNWAFNKVLATFFSFHIDIWWTFIVYLKPAVKIIFQTFLKLGLLGISFQSSITADLLALVSFHVYCIYAYAAKLYSIQISSLISLWRLFLGRKKNPLREKVDSCRYSPEQLFVGTLGFTILLFLLPTTLVYYFVFTCIRLLNLLIGAILRLIRYISLTLPAYSTILWIKGSPKVSVGIEITPDNSLKSEFLLLRVKPVTYSWRETVAYFSPECVTKPSGFKLYELLSSLISGKLIYPI